MKNAKILHVLTDAIELTEIPRALKDLGYEVIITEFRVPATTIDEDAVNKLKKLIAKKSPDYVISYNFIPNIARATNMTGVSYISWIYDCPQTEIYTEEAFYPNNYIFDFDKAEVARLKALGLKHVYYMPLAVYGKKVKETLQGAKVHQEDGKTDGNSVADAENSEPMKEITFTGQLYTNRFFDELLEKAPVEYEGVRIREELNGIVDSLIFNYDESNGVYSRISSRSVEFFDANNSIKVKEKYPYIDKGFFYEAAVISRVVSNRERLKAINTLSKEHEVYLCTFDKDLTDVDTSVRIIHGVTYEKEASKLYRDSKINLNITLHCIEKGACQRIFDVMAAGGFVLSNYQEALTELFIPDKEIVLFDSYEDLCEKVNYYLTHEDERAQIAKAGQQKVLKEYTYENVMPKVLDIVDEAAAKAGFKDTKEYDALIMVTPNDFKRVEMNYDRLVRFLPVRKIIFVGSAAVGEMVKDLPYGERVGFINENDILSFDDVHAIMERNLRDELNGSKLPRNITGWYYQQFLKMQYAYLCKDEYYMVWDGDTVPCGEFSMFKEDTEIPYLDLKHEEHEDYFVTLEKILPGMHKIIGPSFISEHMLMRCDIMKKLIETIERNGNILGERFYEKILNAIEPSKLTSNSFSEFETYGTFTALTEPNTYMLRDWHSFRYGAEFFRPTEMDDGDYAWLKKDFFAISFEKNQSVREDHDNLFNNKDYQKLLSARKMLEVVQEAMNDGYREEWN